MLAIRVDGNNEIGTGHVQRCMSIAVALKEIGITPIFIIADRRMSNFILSRGFMCVSMDTAWDSMELERFKLFEIINEYKINTIILDSYYITDNYIESVGEIVSLYYIDDFYNKCYKNLEGVISYNISCNFSVTVYEYGTKLLLGTKYMPLRKEFQNISPINIYDNVKNIMLTTGGTDKYFIIEELLNIFKNEEVFKDIIFHVIIGNFFSNKEELKKISEQNNIILYENIDKISSVMLKSDMAISAGGTTLYELCVCGVPTVAFTIAGNQVDMTKAFYKDKIIVYSGHCDNNKQELLKNILDDTVSMMKDNRLRQEMHNKAIEVVDGKGAERIAKVFL